MQNSSGATHYFRFETWNPSHSLLDRYWRPPDSSFAALLIAQHVFAQSTTFARNCRILKFIQATLNSLLVMSSLFVASWRKVIDHSPPHWSFQISLWTQHFTVTIFPAQTTANNYCNIRWPFDLKFCCEIVSTSMISSSSAAASDSSASFLCIMAFILLEVFWPKI